MISTIDEHNKIKTLSTALRCVDAPAGVVDLFRGAGALSHGFLPEGFDIACGFDVNESCGYPFQKNNRAPLIGRDVSLVRPEALLRRFPRGRTSLLVDCAPRQPFSKYTQGRDGRGLEDPKWRLLKDFARLVTDVRPDIAAIENVPQLLKFRKGAVFREFVGTPRDRGYRVRHTVAQRADFGAPQSRVWLVLIGSRYGSRRCRRPPTGRSVTSPSGRPSATCRPRLPALPVPGIRCTGPVGFPISTCAG